jgi:hypothetical protein
MLSGKGGSESEWLILNVKVKLGLRMDEDHIWIIDVAFIKVSCQLEVL